MLQGGDLHWRTQLPAILHLRILNGSRSPIRDNSVDLAGKSALLRCAIELPTVSAILLQVEAQLITRDTLHQITRDEGPLNERLHKHWAA